MPPAPWERDFYEELLVALGTVLPAGLSTTALRHRSRIAARQLEVRMLIIDEIHSMLAGTFREQRIFLNSIRFPANDLRIPLVCVGTHEAKQALMTDQQLADRRGNCEGTLRRDDCANSVHLQVPGRRWRSEIDRVSRGLPSRSKRRRP